MLLGLLQVFAVITVATSVCNIGSDQRLCNADCLRRRRNIETGWYLDMLHVSECSGRVIAIIFEPLDGLSDDDRFEFTIALWKKIGTTTHFEKLPNTTLTVQFFGNETIADTSTYILKQHEIFPVTKNTYFGVFLKNALAVPVVGRCCEENFTVDPYLCYKATEDPNNLPHLLCTEKYKPTGNEYPFITMKALISPLVCPNLTLPNGNVLPRDGNQFGDVVTFSCNSGFELSEMSSPTATCLVNKQWSNPLPSCVQEDININVETTGLPTKTSVVARALSTVFTLVFFGVFFLLIFSVVFLCVRYKSLNRRRKFAQEQWNAGNAVFSTNEHQIELQRPFIDNESSGTPVGINTDPSYSVIPYPIGRTSEGANNLTENHSSELSKSRPINYAVLHDEMMELYEMSDSFIPGNDEMHTDNGASNYGPQNVKRSLTYSYVKAIDTLEQSVASKTHVPYQPPATHTDGIYAQLRSMEAKWIELKDLELYEIIGSGHFGTVSRGALKKSNGEELVAVKRLRDDASEEEKIKFLQEAVILSQFSHMNVLKLHGVVVEGEVLIVTELLQNGDLRMFLTSLRPTHIATPPANLPLDLLKYSQHICQGMCYLSAKGFVHRDLAARNILVSSEGICKVADFGMSRDLDEDSYYIAKRGGMIPVKWTAPEALTHRKYSIASDVWSFGCVLYEIWTLGFKPFQGFDNNEVLPKLMLGYRLPPPPGCPYIIYKLMIDCWNTAPKQRPMFDSIMLELLQPKLELSQVDLDTHPEACRIGSPLQSGKELYSELQELYRKKHTEP